jgi:hypothetical protein
MAIRLEAVVNIYERESKVRAAQENTEGVIALSAERGLTDFWFWRRLVCAAATPQRSCHQHVGGLRECLDDRQGQKSQAEQATDIAASDTSTGCDLSERRRPRATRSPNHRWARATAFSRAGVRLPVGETGRTVRAVEPVAKQDRHAIIRSLLPPLTARGAHAFGRISLCAAVTRCPSQDEGTKEFASTALRTVCFSGCWSLRHIREICVTFQSPKWKLPLDSQVTLQTP